MGITLNYPWISAGYVGFESEAQTLNSCFFSLYDGVKGYSGPFPQRIPRIDFFEEMTKAEGPEFSKIYNDKNTELIVTLQNCEQSPETIIPILNNLMRKGVPIDRVSECFAQIEDKFPAALLLKCIWKTNEDVSKGTEIDEVLLSKLSSAALSVKDEQPRLYQSMVLRTLISLSRHGSKKLKKVSFNAKQLLQELMTSKPQSFSDYLHLSCCYRGIAMVPSFSLNEVKDIMDLAWQTIDFIAPTNDIQVCIAKENRLVLSQSTAKFHKINNDTKNQERYLIEMTKIDECDSTGWTELGLFYSSQEKWIDANSCFKTAVNRGPPSLAMNNFFLGYSYSKLSEYELAEKAYHDSFSFDPTSSSPLIEILKLPNTTSMSKNKIIEKILGDSELYSQVAEQDKGVLNVD